ncbi:MAG: hypothetical protein ACOCRA_04525 [Halobacteria archaeon]
MRLDDYVEIEVEDDDRRLRKLAQEKSYEVLDYLDGFDDRFEEVRQGDSLFGSTSPSVFVGRSQYPRVPVGVLSPVGEEEDAADFTTSGDWFDRGMGIEGVLRRRTGLLNSRRNTDVDVSAGGVTTRFVDASREVAMADEPVDVEVRLRDEPDVDVSLDNVRAPTGPNVTARDAELAENPSVPRAVEKAFGDDDWKAEGAVAYLYDKGFDVYEIDDVFSAGAVGQGDERRLVPTRWSITAVDDILGKHIHDEILDYPSVDETTVHVEEYMGNRYWVILAPGRWEYELVEVKSPGNVWNPSDDEHYVGSANEGYEGRSSYVDETSGAYYASRLGVLEHLRDERRQAKALVVREATDAYWAPVGVWQIRESVRNAFDDEGATAETFHDAARQVVERLPVSEERFRRKSAMYNGVQTGLGEF